MKKVLIALDYDPTAQKVAETGFKLAKTLRAEVILLHVIANSTYYSMPEYSSIMGFNGIGVWNLLQDDDDLKKTAIQFLEKSKIHLGDDSIQTLVKDSDPAKSILEAAEDLHANIIVMGSHSRKWLENIIMGSVTEKVLKHTTIPVFIVPTKQNKNKKRQN